MGLKNPQPWSEDTVNDIIVTHKIVGFSLPARSLGEVGTLETMVAELSDMKRAGWTDGMKMCSVLGVRERESKNRQP